MRITAISPLLVLAALMTNTGEATAQTETEVAKADIEDSFFNQCTGERVDRSYTRHIRRRNPPGGDVVFMVTWSNAKGVGQESGRKYTMTWRLQQHGQTNETNEQGVYTYRIRTTVNAQGSASDYTSNTVIKLRTNANGDVHVDETEATGIQCS